MNDIRQMIKAVARCWYFRFNYNKYSFDFSNYISIKRSTVGMRALVYETEGKPPSII